MVIEKEHKKSLINEDGETDESRTEQEEEFKKGARQSALRWVLLTFGNFFLFGSYYCYDIPSALSIDLKSGPDGLSDKEYNALYSVYSFPNIILPLLGGIIADKIGVKISLMMFSTFVVIG